MTILQWFIFFIAVQLIHFGGVGNFIKKREEKVGKPLFQSITL